MEIEILWNPTTDEIITPEVRKEALTLKADISPDFSATWCCLGSPVNNSVLLGVKYGRLIWKKVHQRTARWGECLNSSRFLKISLGERHWSHSSACINFCYLRTLVGCCWDKWPSFDLTACWTVMGCWGAKLMDDNMGLNGINASRKYQQEWKLRKIYSTFFSPGAKDLKFVLYIII